MTPDMTVTEARRVMEGPTPFGDLRVQRAIDTINLYELARSIRKLQGSISEHSTNCEMAEMLRGAGIQYPPLRVWESEWNPRVEADSEV